jgi:CRISPR/Cas system-associated exonuclease Cas4 (RecB family)
MSIYIIYIDREEVSMLPHISYSMIKHYEICPLRYKHKYIDGVKEEKSEGTESALRLHKAMELFIKDDAKADFSFLQTDDEWDLFQRITFTLLEIPTSDLIYPINNPALIPEMRFQVNVPNMPIVKGVFDIVMVGKKQVRIVDLKTGWGSSKYGDVQSSLYILCARELWPGWDVSFAFWEIRRNEVVEKKNVSTWDMFRVIAETIERDNEYKPVSSYKNCRYCPFKYMCKSAYLTKQEQEAIEAGGRVIDLEIYLGGARWLRN